MQIVSIDHFAAEEKDKNVNAPLLKLRLNTELGFQMQSISICRPVSTISLSMSFVNLNIFDYR